MRMFILSSQCCEVFDRDVMNVIIQKILNSCSCGGSFCFKVKGYQTSGILQPLVHVL